MKAVLFWLTDAEAEAFRASRTWAPGVPEALDALDGAARGTCTRLRCDIRLVHNGQYLADVMYDATGCSNIVLPERRRCRDHMELPATHVDSVGYGWCRACVRRPEIARRGLVLKPNQLAICDRCPHSTIIHDQEGCPVEGCDCCLDENGIPPAEGM